MKIFTDNPIQSVKEDTLGFAPYARILCNTIRDTHTEQLPFCIGIFGEWGSGKSSFMKMIQDLLPDDMPYIWFNPWKYDRKEELWHALIQSILYQIVEQTPDKDLEEKSRKLALSTTWLVLKKTLTTVTGGLISGTDLDTFMGSINEKDQEHYKHINRFEQDFTDVVDRYTQGGKLVIFIDDLDRCLPENAITVLESLKLFIGNAHCVFVLGMDHHIVQEGIKYRYHFSDRIDLSGRDYLEKIVQVPFYLPPVQFQALREALTEESLIPYPSEEIWTIIELGMQGNPRKTRRFVNCFALLQHIMNDPDRHYFRRQAAEQGGMPLEVEVLSPDVQRVYLAKLLVFQMSFPDFYVHLRHSPHSWQNLERDLVLQDNTDRRRQVLREEPELAPFWDNAFFKKFMQETAPHQTLSYPEAPDAETVSQLLGAISLVSETDDNPPPANKGHGSE
jgi:ABC-type oligopeptide transport system ATPase subunit